MKKKRKSKGQGRLKLTALVRLLDFSNINLLIGTEKKRGRPPRNPEAMLKAFIVMTFKGFSEREIETFLRNYPFWSRLCGFKGIAPCHATFSNFKRRIDEDTLKLVMKNLVQQLIDLGAIQLVKAAIDSSTLSAVLTDLEAKWGCTRKGFFFG